MNRQEKIAVAIIFLAILGWTYLSNQQMAKQKKAFEEAQAAAATNEVQDVSAPAAAASSDVPTAPATGIGDLAEKIETVPEPVAEPVVPQKEEKIVELEDERMKLNFTSWGGGIRSIELKDFMTGPVDSQTPVVMGFEAVPALNIAGITGLGKLNDFDVEALEDSVVITRAAGAGLSFKRTVELDADYRLKVTDEFVNTSDASISLDDYSVEVGTMRKDYARVGGMKGIVYLDVNGLGADTSDKVLYWDVKPPKGHDKLSARFNKDVGGGGCGMFGSALSAQLPEAISPVEWSQPTKWVSLKNRFFIQTLMPDDEASGYVIRAARTVPETEDPAVRKTWSKRAVLGEVGASMTFEGVDIAPGGSFARKMTYYAGPQKYDNLKAMGNQQESALFRTWAGWGWFRYVCVGLIKTLNAIYAFIPNYGVAIIILTILVKILFWPVMQKSTASMKKMQDLKPQLDALKEKHQKNPQKMQQEQMALYKKHGVNPMASCLPMLIQMPVFIAMFSVIRKAVELRSAGFLWISDLSQPELLLEGMIPIAGSLNILPIAMCVTMVLQQKMTPSSGDPQQKQMMMMMPVMMLVLFYNMASGLTLYWTVSQLLSIAQLYFQNRKKPAEAKA